jgi:hypothetical protein
MTNPEPPSDVLMREQRLQRNLKIVVAGLSALILLGLGAVAVRVVGLATNSTGSSQTLRPITAGRDGATASFELPKGAKIVSISLSGGRLAIHHDGPGGPGIAILDVDTGRRVLEMTPVETLPRN